MTKLPRMLEAIDWGEAPIAAEGRSILCVVCRIELLFFGLWGVKKTAVQSSQGCAEKN